MLHLATIMVVRASMQLIATQHDNIMILSPLKGLRDDIDPRQQETAFVSDTGRSA